ncbi:rhodanese domain-containing protein CG4456-like [Musca vetustissima]|uniref:rhodanese domain-containing protein CG4456-like n=1 Tax=Musca vetustissima TaxID=27455 RepID=UPI002AB661E5|nr:rhodanese domain-containing protein CG4456-like [Musca vetustissima]
MSLISQNQCRTLLVFIVTTIIALSSTSTTFVFGQEVAIDGTSAMGITSSAEKMSGKIEIVSYEFVKNLPKDHPEILLIDVREPHELQATGQIPTSINIPLGTVKQVLGPETSAEEFKQKFVREKPSLDSPIVFYCRSGRRSQEAAETAVALGYTNIKNYKGSWLEWSKREGLPQ